MQLKKINLILQNRKRGLNLAYTIIKCFFINKIKINII